MAPVLLLVLGCVAGDLAAGRPVTGAVVRGDPAELTSGGPLADGTPWDGPGAIGLAASHRLVVDLGEARAVGALWLQADDNDAYVVEGSLDGSGWTLLFGAPPSDRGPGLRARTQVLAQPVDARLLRVYGRGGDGHYAVGRLQVFCARPERWPGGPGPWNPLRYWGALDNDSIVTLKGVVAAAGALLLLAGALLAWRGRERVLRRTRDALLAGLGLVALASWWNLGHFHFEDFEHPWDIYHYHIGAKYFPELGYAGMYECTTVAEAELYGRDQLAGRTVRDLVTNELVPVGPILADPGRCTARFSAERWDAFKVDIAYFRGQFSAGRWLEVLHDHGYNGTPIWGAVGRALASLGPASRAQIHALALLDPALLLLMWAVITWAFGWRVACVGLLFFGTNYPARYYWNGGAFLRQDWLALAMIGICLVKKGRPGAGGFALAWSALLRVFPGFVLAGLLLSWLVTSVRAGRLVVTLAARRFVLGAVAAAVVLVPVGLWGAGRPSLAALTGFVENSRKHLDTPLTNNMGWKTVVAYEARTRARVELDLSRPDPWVAWKDARRRTFSGRLPLYLLGLVGFLVLLGRSAAPLPDWAALTLGVGLIPFVTELTCYYYSVLLAYAFLWPRRPLVGAGLALLAAATCLVPRLAYWEDARYFDCSVQVLVFVVAATVLAGLRRPGDGPTEA